MTGVEDELGRIVQREMTGGEWFKGSAPESAKEVARRASLTGSVDEGPKFSLLVDHVEQVLGLTLSLEMTFSLHSYSDQLRSRV